MPDSNELVNILMVDDKRANLVALEAILACPSYNLVKATSGEEALKHVLTQDFAVILLDVMMPEMDGFEFARLVRQRVRSQSTPIIFLTAIAKDTRFQHQGYAVGAVDYLQKPLDPDIVKAKVSVFVELFLKNKQIKMQEMLLREAQRREQEYRINELKHSSEQHYRELADSLLQAIWTADKDRTLTFVSSRWYDYTGTQSRLYPTWDDIVASIEPEDARVCEELWKSIADGEEPTEFECECRVYNHTHKSYRWNLCRAVPERDNKGNFVGWVGTFTDIHTQKRAEESQRFITQACAALNASLDYHACLSESAKVSTSTFADIIAVDLVDTPKKVSRFVHCKAAFKDTRLVQALEDDSSKSDFPASLTVASKTRKISRSNDIKNVPELAYLHEVAEPELTPLSVITNPIFVNSNVVGVATLIRVKGVPFDDIDEKICAEIARHANPAIANALAHEKLQRANRAKDEFLALLSHELRTPLNAMIGWAQFLKLNDSKETFDQGLEVIERNGYSLAQLVSDLLDVSRIVTGKLQIERQPIDLHKFLHSSVECIRPLAEAKGLKLNIFLSHERSLILGDTDRLQQVISNLLTNAIKFTPEGGKVEVYLNDFSDSVVIMVRDTGQGIRADFLPHIFDRFSQADATTTRKHAGLGLGLAIVRHIAELHGGSISVQSDGPGQGSCFTLVLPKSTKLLEDSAKAKSQTTQKMQPDLAGTSVFVVDDDQTSRDIVVAFLKRSGASVHSAGSVREAMIGIKQFRPQVVISDIGMPEEDGYDLLRKLKALSKEVGIPIRAAALTAYASSEDAVRALDAGFDAHFSKPFKFDELLGAIAKLAKASEQAHEKTSAVKG